MNPEILHIDDYLSGGRASEENAEGNLCLWINSDQVSFHKAELPNAPKNKWMSLLPWILEDQLLLPVEDLHLIVCSVNSERVADIASIPKQEMHRLQLLLEGQSQQVRSVIPDILALPLDSEFITLARVGDRLLVRSGQYEGYSGTTDFVWSALQLQHAQAQSQGGELALQCFGLDSVSVPDWAESLCSFNANSINWSFSEVVPEANLLTADFRPHRKLLMLGRWMPSLSLATLALVLFCTWALVDHVKSGRELNQLNQQVLAEFEASFGQQASASNLVQSEAANMLRQREQRFFAIANSVMDITYSLDTLFSSCSDCDFTSLQITPDRAELTMAENTSAIARLANIEGFASTSGAVDEAGQIVVNIRRVSP